MKKIRNHLKWQGFSFGLKLGAVPVGIPPLDGFGVTWGRLEAELQQKQPNEKAFVSNQARLLVWLTSANEWQTIVRLFDRFYFHEQA